MYAIPPKSTVGYLIWQLDFTCWEVPCDRQDLLSAIHDWMAIIFHELVYVRWIFHEKKSSQPFFALHFLLDFHVCRRRRLETNTQILTDSPIVPIFNTRLERPISLPLPEEHSESIPPTIAIDALALEHSLV